MQAIVLAAGMGKRLRPFTDDIAKCMITINEIPIIERMLFQIEKLGLNRIIIVVGYKKNRLMNFIQSLQLKTEIIFIENQIYYRTNNIYSMYITQNYLSEDDTIILESDLILDDNIILSIMKNNDANVAMVAELDSWMNGTVVTLNEDNSLNSMNSTKDIIDTRNNIYFKTVNIYKFSKDFIKDYYLPLLEQYIQENGFDMFYEQVLNSIINTKVPLIKAQIIRYESWYEIDNEEDLFNAKKIFEINKNLYYLKELYGGYWRFPNLLDFCYLVNVFFPTPKIINEMQTSFYKLVSSYPSGSKVLSILAAQLINVSPSKVCVGNGTSELINILKKYLGGNIGIQFPTFEEYSRNLENIIGFYTKENFRYTIKDLIQFYKDKNIGSLFLINPDNPSGNYICKKEILILIHWCYKNNINLILDESFIDFVDEEKEIGVWNDELIEKYPNLIIIKSISKSYGIPGIRLGIMATANKTIMSKVKEDLAIWNINSFGEYFLQIIGLYKAEYISALKKFYKVRKIFLNKLKLLSGLRVMPSQANYVTCEIVKDISATELSVKLLEDYNILIKDLSGKRGVANNKYVRFAIRSIEENQILINALEHLIG